ncbi:MAG TPA: hypothetical protein VFZ59_09505 [Verrucomicrobiae bacterium]|nr:hypothetical protein [Verrucomicrobiae bacterium]
MNEQPGRNPSVITQSMGEMRGIAMSTCSGIANLHNGDAMLQHRKCILLAVVLLVVALRLVSLLLPPNVPKYQGRYLSDWMDDYPLRGTNFAQHSATREAVQQIGTNAVPIFVKWLGTETPAWKKFVRRRVPMRFLQSEGYLSDWLGAQDAKRVGLGMSGISILGTNSASAVPELERLLRNRTDPYAVFMTIHALAGIGGESVPVLKAAFADPTQPQRAPILWCLRRLSFNGHSNECVPFEGGSGRSGHQSPYKGHKRSGGDLHEPAPRSRSLVAGFTSSTSITLAAGAAKVGAALAPTPMQYHHRNAIASRFTAGKVTPATFCK